MSLHEAVNVSLKPKTENREQAGYECTELLRACLRVAKIEAQKFLLQQN